MDLDRFLGCIFGVAVGDALGMPFEGMSRKEIEEKMEISGRFYSSVINPSPINRGAAGCWTDDTQLTCATLEAFTESEGKIDMDVIAQKHKEAYELREGRGWGRSTRNSCKRLVEGVHWSKSGEPGGSGNGVLMKISPLGLLQGIRQNSTDQFSRECITFSRMTHAAPSAIVAACVHAFAIAMLSRQKSEWITVPHFLAELRAHAFFVEKHLPLHQDLVSELLQKIRALWGRGVISEERAPGEFGKMFGSDMDAAFSAYNSFGLSYAMFLRKPDSFDAVYDAIAAGGDTDSNASIVGSLLGALHGEKIIPPELIRQVERSEWIRDRTEAFYNVCSQKNNAP